MAVCICSNYFSGSFSHLFLDGSTRPAFRTTLSQPSQMGNFKHQPLRGSDRDRDRDAESNLKSVCSPRLTFILSPLTSLLLPVIRKIRQRAQSWRAYITPLALHHFAES